MNGTVKWFNKKKGYGFIKGDDEKDYFVHYTAVPRGVFLREEDKVTFDPIQNEKGLQAQNVNKIGGSSAPEKPFSRGDSREGSRGDSRDDSREERSSESRKPLKKEDDSEDSDEEFSDDDDDLEDESEEF
jgi:cold shock protein